MPLLDRARGFELRDAVVSRDGTFHTYGDLTQQAEAVSHALVERLGAQRHLKGHRVAVLAMPGHDFVAAQWAVWRSGACAVPLCVSHPKAEMEYVLDNCGASAIVADARFLDKAQELGLPVVPADPATPTAALASSAARYEPEDPALIIYTSGTTGRPKGVVTRFSALEAQISDQVTAWGWSKDDRILNCLPLHHVHGLVNLTAVPLSCGACVEFIEPEAKRIWKRLRLGSMVGGPLTLFMAVPTIYAKLIAAFDEMSSEEQAEAAAAAASLRLMVSGSAALPTTVMKRWKEITGHTLLERWGMTELGMGLSNPLSPVEARLPGYVGLPMPSAQVKIVDEVSREEVDTAAGESGELLVRGPIVFKEYWNNPAATAKEFEGDGWFKTGDIAAFDAEKNAYRILGRASADIIKSGGYKISALEIERELLEHPALAEIAVLGIPDEEYGERVAAVIRVRPGKVWDEAEFQSFCKSRLAPYKVPRVLRVVDDIPKNAMGKVSKKQLRSVMFG